MDRSGRSTPHRSEASNYTVASLTTDVSDDFLLLSDSPSYEDVENISELEISATEHKRNLVIEDINVDLHQKPHNALMAAQHSYSSRSAVTPIVATPITPAITTIPRGPYQILYYTLIILFTILYIGSFFHYASNEEKYLTLYRVNILWLNLYNGVSIVLYLFIIIACLIFGYQYKNVRDQLYHTHKNAISVVLLRLRKANMSKRKKCINLFKFYRKIFKCEWTEYGIICSLTILHYIVSAILILSQITNYKTTSYNLMAYILTSIRYILNGFAITLPSLCINIYSDHIREYLFRKADSVSVLESDINVVKAPPDIPEDQQTEAGVIYISGKTSQTDPDLQSILSPKASTTANTVFNDRLVLWSVFVMFIVFIVTYQMLCTFHWDIYQHTVHILYGNNNTRNNSYFIINELVLKLFAAMLLLTTCFHIIAGHNAQNHNLTECNLVALLVIKPEYVLFVITMSFIETFIHSEIVWNVICVIFYSILILIVYIMCFIISSKLHEIKDNTSSITAKLSAIRNIASGLVLMAFCGMTNSFILLHDHTNWINIRQLGCSLLNLKLLRLIYTLKLAIDDKRCYKYIKRSKKFKMFFIALIILSMYHICYSILFVVYTYQSIADNKHTIYYRLSFAFSFTIIQFNQWILCQLLCLYVHIFPSKSIGTIASGSMAIGTGARTTHHWRYSASGYPVKRSKIGRPRSTSRTNSAKKNVAFTFV